MISSRRLRHGQILRLISEGTVPSQDDLRRQLIQKGMRVTQATLSRDLQDLKLVKTSDGYRAMEGSPDESGPQLRIERALRELLLEVREAQNLLVLKTPPGGAQSLAAALDAGHWKEVVGTVAGDDTVLVVTPSRAGRAGLQKKMARLLG